MLCMERDSVTELGGSDPVYTMLGTAVMHSVGWLASRMKQSVSMLGFEPEP